eukprot:jgi/Orpsp1_1/1177988/evm.model.c7180000063638.1
MKLFFLFTIFIVITETIWAGNIKNKREVNAECSFINSLLNEAEDFDCCDVVECEDGHIVEISLTEDDIENSTLPKSFGSMPNLKEMDLSGCGLKGSIPDDIGGLTKLEWLSLSENELDGSIPSSIGKLTKLEYLDLNDNKLSGSIPSEIGSLTDLENLDLSKNELSGSIPSTFEKLTKMETLYLSDNALTGSIPSGIGKLKDLKYLWFSDNNISGELPSDEIEKLEDLKSINIENNKDLYGKAPNLKSVSELLECNYSGTSLCSNDKDERCTYPETNYSCTTCVESAKLVDDVCKCDNGLTGAGYIKCEVNNNNN